MNLLHFIKIPLRHLLLVTQRNVVHYRGKEVMGYVQIHNR